MSYINIKKLRIRHIMITVIKIKDTENIIQTIEKGKQFLFKRPREKLIAEVQTETMDSRANKKYLIFCKKILPI